MQFASRSCSFVCTDQDPASVTWDTACCRTPADRRSIRHFARLLQLPIPPVTHTTGLHSSPLRINSQRSLGRTCGQPVSPLWQHVNTSTKEGKQHRKAPQKSSNNPAGSAQPQIGGGSSRTGPQSEKPALRLQAEVVSWTLMVTGTCTAGTVITPSQATMLRSHRGCRALSCCASPSYATWQQTGMWTSLGYRYCTTCTPPLLLSNCPSWGTPLPTHPPPHPPAAH